MIENSVALGLFGRFFRKLSACFDGSRTKAVSGSVMRVLSRGTESSYVINYIKHRYFEGTYWKNSHAYRVATWPVAALGSISERISDRAAGIRDYSEWTLFLPNMSCVKLRQYGFILGAFGAGYGATLMAFGRFSESRLYFFMAIALLSILLIAINRTAKALYGGSFILKVFGSLFPRDKERVELFMRTDELYIKHIQYPILIFALLGFFGALSQTVYFFACVFCALFAVLVIWKFEIGVFALVALLPLLPTMALAALTILCLFSLMLRLVSKPDFEFRFTPMHMPIILFGFILASSCLTSISFVSSVKAMAVYIVFMLAYVLITNSVKTFAHWRALMTVCSIVAALVALYGIYQNFTLTSTTPSWIDKNMFSDIRIRVYSTFDNPNVLGEYFVFLLPVTLAMMAISKSAAQKTVFTFSSGLMLVCLVYTWSRGAWLAAVLAVGVSLLLCDRRWLVPCAVALILSPAVLPESVISRITSVGNVADSSTAYRISVWLASIKIIKDYWFSGIGVGADAFVKVYPAYALNAANFALHAHNFYLQLIIDMGIVGIAAFFALVLMFFKQVWRGAKENSPAKPVLFAMAGSMLGFLLQGMAENSWYNFRIFLLFWVFFALMQSGASLPPEKAGDGA